MLLSDLMDAAPSSGEVPALVRPDHVGGKAAWQTLVRQGAIEALDLDAATVAGTTITPQLRAAAIAPHVPPHTYVVGLSSAWVHCGGVPPEKLHLGHQLGTNRPTISVVTEFRSGSGFWAESIPIGLGEERVRVTTRMRTAVDLSLWELPEDAIRLIGELAQDGLDLTLAARALEMRGRTRARPRARAVFAELLSD